jgi:hypothetical protein
MKITLTAAIAVSLGLWAATGALPETAAAQGASPSARPASQPAATAGAPAKAVTAASSPDMRLWSFGECARNFPYPDSPEHKECVRVVGSDEAKDARAFFFCDTSHAKDPAEAKRCKEAYVENKSRAITEGFRANGSTQPPAPASTATPAKRDQAEAIASLTRALKESVAEESAANAAAAAATAPAPEAAPATPVAPPQDNSTLGNIMLGLAILLLLAGLGMRYLRRMTDAEAANTTTRRGGSNPRTVTGGNPRTVTGSHPRTVTGQPTKRNSGNSTRIISVGAPGTVAGLPRRQY